jgi:hypothetical protein
MINSNPDAFKTVPVSLYGDYFTHYNDIVEIHNKIFKYDIEKIRVDRISIKKPGLLPILKKYGHEILADTYTNTLTNNQLADLLEEVTKDMINDIDSKWSYKHSIALDKITQYITLNIDREKYAPLIQPYCIDFMRSAVITNNEIFNTKV